MAWASLVINMLTYLLKPVRIALWLFVTVSFIFFFVGGPTNDSSQLFGALWDCGHLLFFIAVVILLSEKYPLNNGRVVLTISAGVFLSGGLIEIIQAHIGRDGNWDDLLRDLTGAWLALFWLQPANKWVWCGRVLACVLLFPNIYRVAEEAVVQLHNERQFPVIADFESPLDLYGHSEFIERSNLLSSQGKYSLKLHLTKNVYSGITFDRLVADWSAYTRFSVDIYIPDKQPLDMVVRIHDVQHEIAGWIDSDRFNKPVHLNPGWNHLFYSLEEIQRAPATRLMDLSHIKCIVIYATRLPATRDIYIDNIRLE